MVYLEILVHVGPEQGQEVMLETRFHLMNKLMTHVWTVSIGHVPLNALVDVQIWEYCDTVKMSDKIN